jgi:hypothetical protein
MVQDLAAEEAAEDLAAEDPNRCHYKELSQVRKFIHQ